MLSGFKVAGRPAVCALALSALLASVLAGSAGGAQGDATASQVADIAFGVADSNPEDFTDVNGTAFFAANDFINGQELWMSDGTPAGTTMVDDDAPPDGGINPGAGSSSPSEFANVNGTLFFNAGDGTNGGELWMSDGTPAGTTMVDDDAPPDGGINPGAASSGAENIVNVNGTLFFVADDGTNGRELWMSDGTPAGTTMVDDDVVPNGGINPGAASSFPFELANVNGTLFFDAADGTNGRELWMSDGTPAGTTMVDDARVPDGGIAPGVVSSDPAGLTNVNGTLFFAAMDTSTNGVELWMSDGTPAGTTMVDDDVVPDGGINPGISQGSHPAGLTNVNGTLFFAAMDGTNGVELWMSDGTPAGTTMVDDDASPMAASTPAPGTPSPASSTPSPPSSPTSTAPSSSPPTTAPTASSCGGATAPRPRPRSSRTPSPAAASTPAPPAPTRRASPTSTGPPSSVPTTAPTASSCGGATAPRPGP